VDQLHFLFFRKIGFHKLQFATCYPVEGVLSSLINELRFKPKDVSSFGNIEEVGFSFVVSLQILDFIDLKARSFEFMGRICLLNIRVDKGVSDLRLRLKVRVVLVFLPELFIMVVSYKDILVP
jgi:hypothetical protein